MLSKREKRIKYLGFDDIWFAIIGIVVLSLSVVYIFRTPADQLTTAETIITFVISLSFSTCDWLINRSILIRLRKKYPRLKDSKQRITLLLIGITVTVLVIDWIGVSLV